MSTFLWSQITSWQSNWWVEMWESLDGSHLTEYSKCSGHYKRVQTINTTVTLDNLLKLIWKQNKTNRPKKRAKSIPNYKNKNCCEKSTMIFLYYTGIFVWWMNKRWQTEVILWKHVHRHILEVLKIIFSYFRVNYFNLISQIKIHKICCINRLEIKNIEQQTQTLDIFK